MGATLPSGYRGSELTILMASHFAWEKIPDQLAAMVAESGASATRATPGRPPSRDLNE